MPDFTAVWPRLDPYGKIGVHKIIPQVIMLMILERQIICKSFALLSQTLSWHIQHRQEEDKSAEEEIESSSSLKEISSSLASVHSSIEDLKDLEDLEGRSSSSFFPSGLDIPTPPVFSSPSHPSRPTTAPGYYNFITIWMVWVGVGWGGVGLGWGASMIFPLLRPPSRPLTPKAPSIVERFELITHCQQCSFLWCWRFIRC